MKAEPTMNENCSGCSLKHLKILEIELKNGDKIHLCRSCIKSIERALDKLDTERMVIRNVLP